MHQPRKRFGQHFLHDAQVIERIVRAIQAHPGQTLVEIGPGLGALTAPLLKSTGALHAVELDRDVIPLLEQHCAGLGRLEIHQADALKFDFCQLAPETGKTRVAGNLPYNISTPLLFHLLNQAQCIEDMHFMLQKEVVDRLAAGPGTADYGRLSVMVQYRCAVTPLFHIGRGAFRPPPKVESAVVRLVPYTRPPVEVMDERLFQAMVTQAFSQRRKTLRNGLKSWLGEAEIRAAGVDPELRPERLTLEQFAALANRASAAETDTAPLTSGDRWS